MSHAFYCYGNILWFYHPPLYLHSPLKYDLSHMHQARQELNYRAMEPHVRLHHAYDIESLLRVQRDGIGRSHTVIKLRTYHTRTFLYNRRP